MTKTRWARGVDVGRTRLSVAQVSEHGEVDGLQGVNPPRAHGATAMTACFVDLVENMPEVEVGEREGVRMGIGFSGPLRRRTPEQELVTGRGLYVSGREAQEPRAPLKPSQDFMGLARRGAEFSDCEDGAWKQGYLADFRRRYRR